MRNKLGQFIKGHNERLGVAHTKETKKKISEFHKGKPSGFKGKEHTEESKRKLSISKTKPRVQCKEEGCQELAPNVSCVCKKHRAVKGSRIYRERYPEKRNSYYRDNKEKVKAQRYKIRDVIIERQRKWRRDLKLEVFTHYSNGKPKCKHCGFDDIRALCLDHVNNDGAEQRRNIRPKNRHRGGSSIDVYIRAKRNKFPKDLQVLCSNCNRIKEHKRINESYEPNYEHDKRRDIAVIAGQI